MPTNQTQTALAKIQATSNKTQTAKASIAIGTKKTQTAKAKIKATTNRTQTSVAKIKATTLKTQTSVAKIQATTNRTQTARARIIATALKTQTSVAKIKATTLQTQHARARISTPNLALVAAATPALTVQYGNFKFDSSNGIFITSEPDSNDTDQFGAWYCEFSCRLTDDQLTGNDSIDDAAFSSLINNLETNLKIPRQRLLAKYGSQTFRDWNFNQAAQTAFLIHPELTLIRQNRHYFTYGFRVRCRFPGNVPSNSFRLDSTTAIGQGGIRERRSCTITATWTSSAGSTAYAQYQASGDAFFTAYLPSNESDQYGNLGSWVRADENPAYNDENSLVTATRVYWEVFSGRRDSTARAITTIGDRRVFEAPSTWTTSQDGSFTALQNYNQGGNAFYAKILPAPISAGATWVLIDEEPAYNDRNGILVVTRTYHEVINGLREYRVNVNTLPNQLRQVTVTGTYYTTDLSAKANHDAHIDKLISDVMAAQTPAMTRFESKSVPKYEGYDTTGLRYFFTRTHMEIAYPQGTAADDPNVTISQLVLKLKNPKDPQSLTPANSVTRLSTCEALFTATIDYNKNQDPVTLWYSGLSAYVLNAVISKLGPNVRTVDIVDEEVGPGLHDNTLMGRLVMVVTGGSILSLRLSQTLTQIPGRDFAPRADGTTFSAYPYRDVAEKILKREAVCEYVLGLTPPTIFGAGDNTVSGFGFIDTGLTAQQSVDDQNSDTQMTQTSGWFIDRRAPVPYASVDVPVTRGTGFQTVMHVQVETWRYLANLEPGTTL